MINYITGDDITAEVKMIRNAFKGTILIVEGDQDSLLFEKFIKNDNCRTIPEAKIMLYMQLKLLKTIISKELLVSLMLTFGTFCLQIIYRVTS